MPNIKLILEYDGTHYHGWQRQSKHLTIQGALEITIWKISNEKVTVIGAGRTDAGVHATGQVANFKTRSRLQPGAWQRAMNSLLPKDIVIKKTERVPDHFHARYHATSKIYKYHVLNRSYREVIGRQYQWVVFPSLNLTWMRRAARLLSGKHDFSAFRAGGMTERTRSPICTIHRLVLSHHPGKIFFTIEADRFLHQMVRIIVGTMVEVGKGKRSSAEISGILAARDRARAGQTAPPHGLFLTEVKYE